LPASTSSCSREIERGERAPSVQDLLDIVDGLGEPLSRLIALFENEPIAAPSLDAHVLAFSEPGHQSSLAQGAILASRGVRRLLARRRRTRQRPPGDLGARGRHAVPRA